MARLTPERRAFIEQLAGEVLAHYPRGRLIIAVDGPDGAGKREFADDLARELEKHGHPAFRASIDAFHRPSEYRYRKGRFSPEGCYEDSYNYSVLRRVLLEPFRMGGSTAFVAEAFDYVRDVQIEPKWLTGPPDLYLIIDGVFLNRPELRGSWNFTIWVDADAAVRAQRLLVREGVEPGSELALRYTGAQELYERDARARDAAAAIVDNTDPDHPKRIFEDSC
jgi:uridine kinase